MRILVGVAIFFVMTASSSSADDIKASQLLVKQGFFALQNGEAEKGMQLLERALEVRPDNHIALATLAQAYTDFKSDYDTALTLYKKALAIKGDHDMTHFGLGLTYQAMGRFTEAKKEFKETIAVTESPTVKRIAQQALTGLGE